MLSLHCSWDQPNVSTTLASTHARLAPPRCPFHTERTSRIASPGHVGGSGPLLNSFRHIMAPEPSMPVYPPMYVVSLAESSCVYSVLVLAQIDTVPSFSSRANRLPTAIHFPAPTPQRGDSPDSRCPTARSSPTAAGRQTQVNRLCGTHSGLLTRASPTQIKPVSSRSPACGFAQAQPRQSIRRPRKSGAAPPIGKLWLEICFDSCQWLT